MFSLFFCRLGLAMENSLHLHLYWDFEGNNNLCNFLTWKQLIRKICYGSCTRRNVGLRFVGFWTMISFRGCLNNLERRCNHKLRTGSVDLLVVSSNWAWFLFRYYFLVKLCFCLEKQKVHLFQAWSFSLTGSKGQKLLSLELQYNRS